MLFILVLALRAHGVRSRPQSSDARLVVRSLENTGYKKAPPLQVYDWSLVDLCIS